MNKKQLAVIWVMALGYLTWALWAITAMLKIRHDSDLVIKKIPSIVKANLLFILPLIIISCIVVFVLQDKEK